MQATKWKKPSVFWQYFAFLEILSVKNVKTLIEAIPAKLVKRNITYPSNILGEFGRQR